MNILDNKDLIKDLKEGVEKIFQPTIGMSFVHGKATYRMKTSVLADSTITANITRGSSGIHVVCSASKVKWDYLSYPQPSYTYSLDLATFGFTELDGGFTIVVCNAYVNSSLQNRGYGVKLHKLRLELLKKYGAPSVIATCNIDNDPQVRIFEKFKWNKTQLDSQHLLWHKNLEDL